MSVTAERIAALVAEAPVLVPWVGDFDAARLEEWLRLELGGGEVLDGWVARGAIVSRAVPLSPLLHVVSGNTPHAAFQSVFRGLLVGALNRVKLPSAGLPEFEGWMAGLPEILARQVEVRRELPEEWLDAAGAVIFGDEETMATFRRLLADSVVRIEHGPKTSVAVIFEPCVAAAEGVAADILRYEQQGCLSVRAVYVEGDEARVLEFGGLLAAALERHRARFGRAVLTLSEAGAIQNARALAKFLVANGEGGAVWESEGSTSWTLVHRREAQLVRGPLNGFAFLHPLPAVWDREILGLAEGEISTMAIYPFTEEHAMRLDGLSPPRICAVGQAQHPTIFWHHDGFGPLSSLVRWRDMG